MRERSTLRLLDDFLLVAVITAVAAFLVFNVVGWIIGAVFFLVKLAVIAGIAGVAYMAVSGRRHRAVGYGRRRMLP
jgi:uncharacterized membrane protein YdbT with pleckstrin-like domain